MDRSRPARAKPRRPGLEKYTAAGRELWAMLQQWGREPRSPEVVRWWQGARLTVALRLFEFVD